MAEEEHLYKNGAKASEERKFEKEYGPEKGKHVYGATVGKVAREQAAKNGGVKREEVPGHIAISDRGTPYHVKGHYYYVHSVPHSRGHHSGPCDGPCRRGQRPHRHKRGRR